MPPPMGSPPHTRGKPDILQKVTQVLRLTPAHAGKTRWMSIRKRQNQAHPRTRGENYISGYCVNQFTGSPPHTRGKHIAELESFAQNRLTPAHAGKTLSTARSRTSAQAHPRTRGENGSHLDIIHDTVGSPPHTRGKHALHAAAPVSVRLTPAHAGKTAWRQYLDEQRHGSPPHTRGKRLQFEPEHKRNRLTPAHAGKTLKKPRISKDFLSWLITVYLVPNKFYESTYSLSMPYAPVWHPAKKIPPSFLTHNPPNHPISAAQCVGCP